MTDKGQFACDKLVLATGRSGSKWIAKICDELGIEQKKNRVDIGVRVELPAEVLKTLPMPFMKGKSYIRRTDTTIWSEPSA